MNKLEMRGQIAWVSISDIMPNPLNPRRDNTIKKEQMIRILNDRGWEEPLTVYQKGSMYVLLAGHRRLYAARTANIKEIPVFITDPPESHAQEIERIASLQSGRVNFTQWEWGKFTHERWIAWNRPPISRFAKQINLPSSTVRDYIRVFEYFPRSEIEAGLVNKSLSFEGLVKIIQWISALKNNKPTLTDMLTEDMIRKVLVDKLSDGRVTVDALKNRHYTEIASDEDIKQFLIDREATLDNHLGLLGIQREFKNFNGHLISIGLMEKRLPNIAPKTNREKELAVNALIELESQIKTRIKELQK